MFFCHLLVDMTDSPRTAGEGKYRNIKTTIKYSGKYPLWFVTTPLGTPLMYYDKPSRVYVYSLYIPSQPIITYTRSI